MINNNHLIIGLGGTGGKIIRAFRRAIYEEFRSKTPVNRSKNASGSWDESPHPVKIDYLYVDSSESLMDSADPTWRIPGDSLQLGPRNQLRIKGSAMREILSNRGGHLNISEWIGATEQWSEILSDADAQNAGGQKRRLGRLLLACRMFGDEGFDVKLSRIVHELRKDSGEASITFHVCAGLAGGTGSGTLVDVISQIRKKFPEKSARIIVYALLPEKDTKWNEGNYHANGYAALLEINALAVGRYTPWDINDKRGTRLQFSGPGEVQPTFNGCYVFDVTNERGRILSLERDEVSKEVASFLFQKILMTRSTAWSDVLLRFENSENKSEPPVELDAAGDTPERSKRFLSFGIKRLVIPEEEITEYMTYQFARQAILQLHYNNWSKTQQGYIDSPVNDSFTHEAASEPNHNRWCLTTSHLCLESPILPGEREMKWKFIHDEWGAVVEAMTQMAESGLPETWLPSLRRQCEEFFNNKWRQTGVLDFYKTKKADQIPQARTITALIETDLFSNWISGKRSMNDISRLLTEIRRCIVLKRASCDKEITQWREAAESSNLRDSIANNNKVWIEIGRLTDLFTKKRHTVLRAQAELFRRLYEARHKVEAYSFAGELLDQVLVEVDQLISHVSKNLALLTEIVVGPAEQSREDVRFAGLNERISSRCRKDEPDELKTQVVKLYNPSQVQEVTSILVRNEPIQAAQTAAFRRAIAQSIGENPTLGKFHQRLNRGLILDLLEKVCRDEALRAHDQHPDIQVNRILGNNIVDRLARDFSGNPLKQQDYFKTIINGAGLNIIFNEVERQNTHPGSSTNTSSRNFTAIVPLGREFQSFRADVTDAIKISGDGVDVIEGNKENEITFVSLANHFPLRYVDQVRFLEAQYTKKKQDGKRASVELHSEGNGDSFPGLFLMSASDIRFGHLLLLGRAMGLLAEIEDPLTGLKGVYLLEKDSFGSEDPIRIATTDEEFRVSSDVRLNLRLKKSITARLDADFRHASKREDLKKQIELERAKFEAKYPNQLSPERRQFKEDVAEAFKLLG
jgi:hypothetical protein